jgi:hypothetical protein
MRVRNVHYYLEHGFVHNWLVAGPQAIAVETSQLTGENVLQQIVQKHHEFDWGISETAVERGPLTAGLFQLGDYTGSWSYFACQEDHFVEHSGFYATPHYLRSWAYTQLNSKAAQEVLLTLTTHGPAEVWLNGQHIHRQEHFCKQQPESISFKARLNQGANEILVCLEMVAAQGFSYAMALQVRMPVAEQAAKLTKPHLSRSSIRVTIPTLIESISRRNKFEKAAAATYVSQDVFEAGERIQLHWPKGLKDSSAAVVRLMTPKGQIYAEGTVEGTAGDHLFLQFALQIPMGPYRIFVMPLTWEYYERNLRITREISLWSLGRSQHSALPYGTYETRRREALLVASQWTGVFAEVAKMALQQWSEIDAESIRKLVENAGALEIVGLLGMMYRFGGQREFPEDLLQPLENCILNFPYQRTGPRLAEEDSTESERILLYAAEILAGQRYPDNEFSHSGKKGQWHRRHAEELALDWLHQRGEGGFSDWDSSSSFADDLVALSHLVDLAESESVWEMAAVVMDKLFATLAINSYRGVLGSTHGRTCASHVKGGQLEPTSGIARLMWGMGIFNHHIAGPVSLACSENYEFPSIISNIALSAADEIWGRESHTVDSARVVNKVTYKTPDSMLCSAQDYYPGRRGSQEHVWQATLGHAATVFVTHPACASEDDARRPNYWAGNVILPRVAQWKDALIAVYQLPEDDWMGFTHAYFPTPAFDESILRGGWAFARKGDGYLAITAAQGLGQVNHGNYRARELRSYGHQNIWFCHLGRAALDGDFSSFQRKILSLQVQYTESSVHFPTLRGESLSFGWQGPFLRNEREEPLSGFSHYEHPYVVSEASSRQLELRFGENALRLSFGRVDSSGIQRPPPGL